MAARSPQTGAFRGPSPAGLWLSGVLFWCALARPSLAEAAAGALVCAILAAGIARACPIPRADFASLRAMAAGLGRVPRGAWQIARSSARLVRAALFGGAAGDVASEPFDSRGRGRVAPPAVLAARVAGMSLSPTTVVLGLDARHTALRVHVLPAGEGTDA